jgi:epoxyqueuosine reductase
VGCLYCQKVCPVNKDRLKSSEERSIFSENETAAILLGPTENEIPRPATQKLEKLDLIEYLPVLGRNLMALRV